MNSTNPNSTTQNLEDSEMNQAQALSQTEETKPQESKPDGYYGDYADLSDAELDLSFLDDEKPADAE
ncbi:hypothetical protein IPJ91_03390 [bacterium]|nr:MAG: hypothetical protein IPJ91_03390 [bacterium]